MLYNEAKAEKNFTAVSSAIISHELRNPLNSLKGQMEEMEHQFLSFEVALQQVKANPEVSQVTKDSLNKVFNTFQVVSDKVQSAVKNIEYFMHDIFDYTTLVGDDKQFTKMVSTYDIRDSFEDIQGMLMGQIHLKNLSFNAVFEGFSQRRINFKY